MALQIHGFSALGNVIIEVGATSGSGNAQLSSTKSYVYNFGVTSQGAGLSINQISIAAGRNGSNNSDGITVELFRGFGGPAGVGNTLVSSTTFAHSTFTTQNQNYTLGLPSLTLDQGAYSIRVSSIATASYSFRDGLLRLGGTGIVSQSQWIQDSNTGGTAGTTITPQQGYVFADFSLPSGTSVDLGRFHVNASPQANVTMSNAAPATSNSVTESLVAAESGATGGGLVVSVPSPVTQGSSANIGIGLSSEAGERSGTVTLGFSSVQDGSNSTRIGGPEPVGSRSS